MLQGKTDTNTATGAKKTHSVSKEGTTAHRSTCLGSPQFKKIKKKLSPAASCATICMKKGPSKNIFLSFQAISLIPDELQGRGKCYGCGLAGGRGEILWQRLSVRVSMYANMSWPEYICITEKICLMAAFLKLLLLFGIPFYTFGVWEHVHMRLGLDNWKRGWHKRALPPPGEGVRRAQGLVHPIFS